MKYWDAHDIILAGRYEQAEADSVDEAELNNTRRIAKAVARLRELFGPGTTL